MVPVMVAGACNAVVVVGDLGGRVVVLGAVVVAGACNTVMVVMLSLVFLGG